MLALFQHCVFLLLSLISRFGSRKQGGRIQLRLRVNVDAYGYGYGWSQFGQAVKAMLHMNALLACWAITMPCMMPYCIPATKVSVFKNN